MPPADARAIPAEKVRCPTCGAVQEWSDTCRRCKSDLRLLRALADSYRRHRRACLAAVRSGRARAAMDNARRCHALRPDAESHRLMALAALLDGDWETAVAQARLVLPPTPTSHPPSPTPDRP